MDEKWVAILGMVAIAYGTRIAGYWLAQRLPEHPVLDAALRQLPMVSLVSLTAPSVVDAGWQGMVAAAVTWAITWKTGELLYAMVGGVIVFALL